MSRKHTEKASRGGEVAPRAADWACAFADRDTGSSATGAARRTWSPETGEVEELQGVAPSTDSRTSPWKREACRRRFENTVT